MPASFRELGVPTPLVSVLDADGKSEAFPIQEATLPDTLAGRDVLGRGRTGSGKTIAFSLPMVARLAESGHKRVPGRPRGLVLAPTRELATQIAATMEPLADAMGLKVMTIFGGVSQKPQEQKLRAGVDIVVACPGRLEDLQGQKHVALDRVEVTVLDEADLMADMGFLPGVTRILGATPTDAQRLLFSATLDNGIDKLVRRFLSNPTSYEVDELSVPAGEMTHRVLEVASPDDKNDIVTELASGAGRRILFMRTKHQAKKLAKKLTAAGIPAVDLQGNLGQNARERNLALFSAEPADGGVRVLVATDVAARGVHVDDVELVIHVDPPAEHKAYLHRSGRTARAGASGTVVTLVLPEQRRDAAAVLKAAHIIVGFEKVVPGSDAVLELRGEKAEYRKPAPVAPTQNQSGGRGQRSGNGGQRQGGRGGSARQGQRQGSRDGAGRDGAGRDGAGRDGAPKRDARGAGAGRAGAAASGRGTGSGRGAGAGRTGGTRSGSVYSTTSGHGSSSSYGSEGGERRSSGTRRRVSRPQG